MPSVRVRRSTLLRGARCTAPRLLAACLVVASAITAAAPPSLAIPVRADGPDRAGSVLFFDDFEDGLDPAAWLITDDIASADPAGKSQAQFVPENVTVSDGVLAVAARRHCLASGEARVLPTNGDERPEADCRAAGWTPAYSAGRMALSYAVPPGIDFEMRVSARMPQNGVDGSRFAMWTKNFGGSSAYCDEVGGWSDVGEIDLLEYSPGRRNDVPTASGTSVQSEQTTHLGCRASAGDRPWRTLQAKSHAGFDRHNWLEWVVTRVGNDVSYALSDGATTYPVGTHTCGVHFPLTQAQCDAILEQQWQVFLQSEVFGGGAPGYHAPDPAEPFPAQTLLVDWVRITRL